MITCDSRSMVLKIVVFMVIVAVAVVKGWGSSEKIKLKDVQVLTLKANQMTNGRRSAPVPQLKCVGGSAGCSAFRPQVVQCYNRGSDGYDVQWECKADMESQYRFGEIAVSCEGYSHPDDPYILKGSCGLEYSIDYVGDQSAHHDSGYYSSHQNDYHHGHKRHHRRSSGWLSSLIMWGIIAAIAYYIYTSCSGHGASDSTEYASQQTTTPPPPGFRPEYTQGAYPSASATPGSTPADDQGLGGFWTGMGAGGLLGYLFGNRGGNGGYGYGPGYYHHAHHGYNSGYGTGYGGTGYGGGSWFGSGGNSGWFGSGRNTGWFSGNNGSSSWSSTHRRSSPTSSSSSSRTTSGFGGTKRR